MSYEEEVTELRARITELEAALRVAEDNEEDRAGQVAELDEKVRELEAELATATFAEWKENAMRAEVRIKELTRELDKRKKLEGLLRREDAIRIEAEVKKSWMVANNSLEARAEKAEAFIREWNEHPLRSRKDEEKYWYARFKEQQARVAELERAHGCKNHVHEERESDSLLDLFEAREREEG